jgi:hypothetical protein
MKRCIPLQDYFLDVGILNKRRKHIIVVPIEHFEPDRIEAVLRRIDVRQKLDWIPVPSCYLPEIIAVAILWTIVYGLLVKQLVEANDLAV